MEKPKELSAIDTTDLQQLCREYLNYLNSEDFSEDNEYDYYIFEKAMETFYGKDIWDYVNSKLE